MGANDDVDSTMNESKDPSSRVLLATKALESAWESGVVSDFETSIPPEARTDTEMLTELACIDLEHRIQRDAETRIESYTAAFPQLAADDLILLELIRTEYSFRTDRESIDAESYCHRFPQLRREIELMFQLEFNQSGDSHARDTAAEWKCASCDAVVVGRNSGATACQACGQPISIGRYELIQRAGQGAFGYVYRARDPKLDRDVAIKIPRSNRFLMPEESERFLRESRNAAQLDHHGIVRIFDTGRHAGMPFIVSEFVAGSPLAEFLSAGEFEFRESAVLMADVADAVDHAHQRGVIHRDLKPSNIMAGVDRQRLEPRVMDFGLARRDQNDTTVTLEGQAIGTPAYMSPEQARGDLETVGVQSDVYSLGVIFYQLLCGEVPFRGNVQRLIQQVIENDPPSPTRFRNRIPRDLETICMKAINRDPAGRYESVGEFRDDLQRWIDGKPILARRVGATGIAWRWCRRRPVVAVLSGVLAVSILAGLSGIAWQWREAETARAASEADLKVALESVDRVLGHLGSDVLKDIPQAKQLRAEVLDDALVFFQRFALRNPDDPRIEMQVASAHRQVARIQSALGQKEEAGKAYQAAIAGYENLAGRAADREQWLKAAASAHAGYASFLRERSEQQAKAEQEKCLALRKQLTDENPESAYYAAKYAAAMADLGRMCSEPEEVRRNFDTAIDSLEFLVEQHTEPGYKRDLARVLNNYSIKLTSSGNYGAAERARERAIELYEIVMEDDPTDESKRSMYASCCLQMVKAMRGESRLDAARKYQAKAVAAYRQLTEDFPATPRHRNRFATVLTEVADLAQVQHRDEDELSANEEAVYQREILVVMFPSNENYQRSLVDDLVALSRNYADDNREAEAEKRLRQSIELKRGFTKEDSPSDMILLAVGIRDLADLIAESETGKRESETLRQEADELLAGIGVEQVMEIELSNSEKLKILACLVNLANQADDLDSLAEVYRAKIAIYADGVLLDPSKLKRRSGLAKHWSYLGRTLYLTGDIEASSEAYRNAIQIDEGLLADDPDSATYVSQMISHSSSLGHNLYFNGKASEGVVVLRRSLELAKKLHEDRQNEGFRQLRVVLAYKQLGDALALENEDYTSALAAYEQAVSMVDVCRESPGMERMEAMVLNANAWFLVTCPDETLRDPVRSLELSRAAVELSPENASHISTLAFGLYETGEFKEAIKQFEKSSELKKTLAALNTLMIASAQSKLGLDEAAEANYEKAVQLNAANPTEPGLFEEYRKKAAAFFGDETLD